MRKSSVRNINSPGCIRKKFGLSNAKKIQTSCAGNKKTAIVGGLEFWTGTSRAYLRSTAFGLE
jgi:hypothetical protein